MLVENTILRVITEEERQRLSSFYQEHSGSLIFLHKICKKYVNLAKEKPILALTSSILLREELDFTLDEIEYR